MNEELYPYADGDRLEERNTYFYTPALGKVLLHAWSNQRTRILAQLPPPRSAPKPEVSHYVPRGGDRIVTAEFLEWLWGCLLEEQVKMPWLMRLVQKFENVKRLHQAYDAKWRALNRDHYRDYVLYLRAAEIFTRAYQLTNMLQFLNVLLKINDTLCSVHHRLDAEQKGRFAYLIILETRLVQTFLASPRS